MVFWSIDRQLTKMSACKDLRLDRSGKAGMNESAFLELRIHGCIVVESVFSSSFARKYLLQIESYPL